MIGALHLRVDAASAAVERAHAGRLVCRRGCAGCCVDGIRVFEVEAEHIRRHHAELLATGAPRGAGACAMLDAEGGCRVYAHRPYVCRTQGLPLRWLDEREGEVVELRDICELNEAGPAITELPPEACFELGPFEAELRALEGAAGRGLCRVTLRSLFAVERRP